MLLVYVSHINIVFGVEMKNKIAVLGLIVIFILIAPGINANISCNKIRRNKCLLKDNSDDEIKIVFVWGGRIINALIKNIGDEFLFNIPWEISLWHPIGGCFEYEKGTIEGLDKGEITKISLEFQSKYIGIIIVYLNVGGIRKSFDAWWIRSYIIIGLLGRKR